MDIIHSAQIWFLSAFTALNIASASTGTVVVPDQNMIVRDGQYTYNGQTLKYIVRIPQNGGKLTGEFSGVCHGPITGTYKSAPSFAIDNGQAKVTCPILGFKKLSATYVAHLELEKGLAHIDWMGDIPYTEGKGSFTVGFAPVQ